MSFKLYLSKQDTIRFISSVDEFVDVSTEELKAEYKKYLDDLNETHLRQTGNPVVWILRPLDMATYEFALRDARGIAIPNIYTDQPTAREIFRSCVVDVENYPSDWPNKDNIWSYEYRRKCLSNDFANALPPGLVREGAAVLLATLPLGGGKQATTPDGIEVETAEASTKKK